MIKLYQSIQENLHQNNEAKMNTTTNKFIDIKYPADNNNYFEIKQSIIFHSVQLKVTHKMPLWPIVTDDSRSDAEKKLSSTESAKQDNDNGRKGQIEGCEKYENSDSKEDGESTRPLLNLQQSTTTKAEQQSRQFELAEGGELPDSSKHSNDSKQLL
ncbi:unnamed protein product [Trichobilharzia regenti]|nr:unnamed protein product [Trichobilharzia regenti]